MSKTRSIGSAKSFAFLEQFELDVKNVALTQQFEQSSAEVEGHVSVTSIGVHARMFTFAGLVHAFEPLAYEVGAPDSRAEMLCRNFFC